MKKILSLGLFLLASVSLLANTALAQVGTCKLNGQEVPCGEVLNGLGNIIGAGLIFMVVMWVIMLAAGIFWLVMLIHAATKPIDNKAVWILVMVFTNILGAIVYYFVVKREFSKMTQNVGNTNIPPITPPTV